MPKGLRGALDELDQVKSGATGKSHKPTTAKSKAGSAARRAVAQMQLQPAKRRSKPVAQKKKSAARKKAGRKR